MGVRVIVGREQGDSLSGSRAVLYDSTTDWAFGPTFRGWDAEEQAEAFVAWFGSDAVSAARSLELVPPVLRAFDPRSWNDGSLARLYAHWRSHFINDDGELIAKEVRSDDDGD